MSVENGLRQNPSWPPLSLYQNFAIATTEKEISANTFAEICVESAIDSGLPFNKSSSVLNSFFENHEDPGLLESIDEVDCPPTPTASDIVQQVMVQSGGGVEHRNDSGIGLDVAPASSNASSLDGGSGIRLVVNGGEVESLPVVAKKSSTLVININGNNEDEGFSVGHTNGGGDAFMNGGQVDKSSTEALAVQNNNHHS